MSSDDNGSKVTTIPLSSSDMVRHGIEALKSYTESLKPDPAVKEKELFDQVILLQLSFQKPITEAIEVARAVIEARRQMEHW